MLQGEDSSSTSVNFKWGIFYETIMKGFRKMKSKEWTNAQYHRECAKMFRGFKDSDSAEEHELMADEWEREHGLKNKLEDLPF
jgi:hypothetical protein|tara:strand:+ start:210 stop:458 length:249 start_codon:yes stop_codon:yes gene_type:complete